MPHSMLLIGCCGYSPIACFACAIARHAGVIKAGQRIAELPAREGGDTAG